MKNIVGWGLGGLVLVLLCSLLLTSTSLMLLIRPSHRVLATWPVPASAQVSYGGVYLSVVEAEMDWSHFPLNTSRNYYIYTGRDSGTPTYGHVVEFSFQAFPDAVEDHVKNATVTWTEEGVTFEPPSGHRLFIPKEMFLNGR